MAIDPKLVSIKEAKDLPTSEAKYTSDFLFFEDQVLKKSPMSNIYDKVTSGIKGVATQSNAPTVYTPETYPNGLFESYVVREPLTMPNAWGYVVTQAELDANYVYFDVRDGVITKSLSYKNNEILEGSVTPDKTSFMSSILLFGKNRFDKSTLINGFYVNAVTGGLSANASYFASDWIRTADIRSQEITLTNLIHIAFYTKDKIFISGREGGGDTIQVPANAYFCRVSLYNYTAMENNFQIEVGDSKTTYESYQTPTEQIVIPGLFIPEETPRFPKILAPSLFYLLSGQEYNFYFNSFIVAPFAEKLSNYYCSAFGYRGKFMADKLRVTPTDDFNIYFKVENNTKNSTKNINFKTAPTSSGNGVTRKALVIGDSTINQEVIIDHIADFFDTDVMNLSLIGTRQTTSGNKHEGRSGWTMKNYIEDATFSGVSNPFSSGGTFNFANYLTTTSQTIGANDWVFIQLGINDLYGTALMDGSQTETAINDRLNAIKARLEVIINSIKSHNPNIRIGIIQTFPPAISQDATGNLLNSSFYSLEYYLKKGLAKWWEYLLEFYDNQDKRDARIYLIGANAVIDRENDFATANQNIDQYDSTQVEVQVDDVHPVDGYKQVGDMYIGAIKYFG